MQNKKEIFAYGLLATFFLFIQFICRTLEINGNIVWNTINVLLYLLISILLAGFIVTVFFLFKKNLWNSNIKTSKPHTATAEKRIFFISWIVIFICWIPTFLAYYPGILAYDSYVQIEQILNNTYNNHHPLIHTLMIKNAISIGNAIGNANLGVALYTLTQMVFLSVAMSTGIFLLAKRGVNRIWLALTVLYCALCPANSFMAVSMTKDVFFTVCVLLYIYILFYLLDTEKHHFLWDIAYIFSAIAIMLFRNNGKYTLFVFLCLYSLFSFGKYIDYQKKRKNEKTEIQSTEKPKSLRLILCTAGSLLLGSLVISILNSSVSAADGDKREMLSIPIQQLSRCMVYHGGLGIVDTDDNSISNEDRALINEFILHNGYSQYNPLISDPVKRCTNTSVVLNKMKAFVSTYVGLALDYPGDYLNAFFAVNGGYLSVLDKSHATVNLHEGVSGLGYLQTRWEEPTINRAGIHKDSKWPALHSLLEKFAGNNGYLNIPVLRTLVAPGAYFWCYLWLAVWTYFRRPKKYLFPLFFVAGYYITLLLGPTVQLRYLYPLMVLLPFTYLYILFCKNETKYPKP